MADLINNQNVYLQPLDFDNLTTDEKNYIDGLISSSSVYLEKRLNRIFERNSIQEIHNGDGRQTLLLKRPPIQTLTSIVIKGTTDRTITSDSFTWEDNAGIVKWKTWGITDVTNHIGIFPIGHQNIYVNYNGGFDSVPAIIQQIVAEIVIETFDRTLLPGAAQKERIGAYFIDYGTKHADRILLNRKNVLSMYRRHVV